MMPHDSSNSRTHLLGRRKSFPTHDAPEIPGPRQGNQGIKGGTNVNVLVRHKPSKVRREVGVQRFCRMVLLLQLGLMAGVQETAVLWNYIGSSNEPAELE